MTTQGVAASRAVSCQFQEPSAAVGTAVECDVMEGSDASSLVAH